MKLNQSILRGYTMRKTYKIAVNGTFSVRVIDSPMMTLAQAESYVADMRKGGFDVFAINMESL
jgi:hypothetical protein